MVRICMVLYEVPDEYMCTRRDAIIEVLVIGNEIYRAAKIFLMIMLDRVTDSKQTPHPTNSHQPALPSLLQLEVHQQHRQKTLSAPNRSRASPISQRRRGRRSRCARSSALLLMRRSRGARCVRTLVGARRGAGVVVGLGGWIGVRGWISTF